MPVTVPQGVERWQVGRLRAYDRNARTHSPEQVAQIVASIQEFGFTNPLLVAADGEVIAGHGRLLAAQELGLDEVPVIVLGHLTPDQRRAYVIADNQLALNAGWDEELLRAELSDLEGLGFDLSLVGFSDAELSELMPEVEQLAPEDVDPDEAPEPPPEPVTQPGDVWILGKHRLLCGDSTNPQHVERLMDGKKADMVFTDPPYGMKLSTDWSQEKKDGNPLHSTLKGGKAYKPIAGDGADFKPDLIHAILLLSANVDEVFIFGADYFAELLPDRNEGSWVVWDKCTTKDGATTLDKGQGSNFELCWSKKKHKRELARVLHKGLFSCENDKRVHPTQKPVALAEWFFERWGQGKTVVADLYGGSGSTLIACEKTNRHCRMMELDPAYCDVIVKRWEDFTGNTAVCVPSESHFDEPEDDI